MAGMFDDKIDGEVKQHTYRSARVSDVFLELPRSACHELEKRLAEASGRDPDNHVVYEVKQDAWGKEGPYESTTYISCSDMTVRFGREVLLERW